jgi:DNA-binding transcriptional ArsR family regulator
MSNNDIHNMNIDSSTNSGQVSALAALRSVFETSKGVLEGNTKKAKIGPKIRKGNVLCRGAEMTPAVQLTYLATKGVIASGNTNPANTDMARWRDDGIDRQTVDRHLRKLKELGLVDWSVVHGLINEKTGLKGLLRENVRIVEAKLEQAKQVVDKDATARAALEQIKAALNPT